MHGDDFDDMLSGLLGVPEDTDGPVAREAGEAAIVPTPGEQPSTELRAADPQQASESGSAASDAGLRQEALDLTRRLLGTIREAHEAGELDVDDVRWALPAVSKVYADAEKADIRRNSGNAEWPIIHVTIGKDLSFSIESQEQVQRGDVTSADAVVDLDLAPPTVRAEAIEAPSPVAFLQLIDCARPIEPVPLDEDDEKQD